MGKDKKETSTFALDERSQGYVDRQRQAAGDLNRAAIGSGPWAQGTGELFRQGVDFLGQAGQAGNWMGQAGAGLFQGALGGPGGAMAQGLGGLGAYASPYTQQGIAAMIPGYQFGRSMADQAGGQQATRSGAYGGSREAVLRAEQMGNIDREFLQGVNLMSQQGTQMGMNAMMQDRMRNAQNANLGFGMAGNSAQMYQNLANQYGGFDQIQRGADEALAMDEFNRRRMGLGGLGAGLGPTGGTQTNVQEGNFFQDALGVGLTAAGAFFGGPAGATAGAQLGGLGGLGGGGGGGSLFQSGPFFNNIGGGPSNALFQSGPFFGGGGGYLG